MIIIDCVKLKHNVRLNFQFMECPDLNRLLPLKDPLTAYRITVAPAPTLHTFLLLEPTRNIWSSMSTVCFALELLGGIWFLWQKYLVRISLHFTFSCCILVICIFSQLASHVPEWQLQDYNILRTSSSSHVLYCNILVYITTDPHASSFNLILN